MRLPLVALVLLAPVSAAAQVDLRVSRAEGGSPWSFADDRPIRIQLTPERTATDARSSWDEPTIQLTPEEPSPTTARPARGTGSPSRAVALRAVVRLHEAGRLVCTATLVRRARDVGLLSAAHCFYRTDPEGRLLGRRGALVAEGVGALSSESVVIDGRFARCAEGGGDWRACASAHAHDLAWVPLGEAPTGVLPWRICEDPAPRDLTVFGYGLSGRALPRALLQGAFRLRPRETRRMREAVGVGVRVDAGDSGGPVISREDDDQLDTRSPCVRFVAVAVRVRDPSDPADRSRALLEPVGAVALP